MHRTWESLVLERLEVLPSVRFELFYALASLFDPGAHVHPAWRARARAELPRAFFREAATFGPARELWITLPAMLPHDAPLAEWSSLRAAMEAADPRALARSMLKGLLHADDLVDEVFASRAVHRAMRRAPHKERAWLRTLGLVPFRRTAPLATALEALVRDPEAAIATMLRTVVCFWERSFGRTFLDARAQYASTARGLSDSFAASLSDLIATSLLRIRLRDDVLEAVEGRYRVRLRDVERIVVLPSAFNERRYWSAVSGERGAIVYLPWFAPTIELDVAHHDERPVLPTLQALADASRWKIVLALLQGPRSASELVDLFGLNRVSSRPRALGGEADLACSGARADPALGESRGDLPARHPHRPRVARRSENRIRMSP